MDTLSIRPLSSEQAERAKNELNENPKKIIDDLEALGSWLAKQPHINACKDNQFLITFLRGCKYSLERAKEKIDMFYTTRTAIPEIFKSREITPRLEKILNLGLILPLLTVDDKTGSRIILCKCAYDPSEFTIFDIYKVTYMIADMLLFDDDASAVCGHVLIYDLQGLSLGHVGQFTPSFIKKAVTILQEAYPTRQKGIHIINSLPLLDSILNIVKSFLSSKLKNRIFVHDSLEALHKHVNKELLPIEYGGSTGSVQSISADLKDKVMQRREWFIEDEKYGTDESKRLGTPKTAENLFGTVGSFRSLDFD